MGVDTSEHRSADTTSLLNYAFNTYKLNTILKTEDIVDSINIKKGKQNTANLVPVENVTDLIKQNEKKEYTYNISKFKVVAPVNKGDVVGEIEVVDNSGKVVKKVGLTVTEAIEKHSFFSLFIENLKKVINGF